MPGGGLIQLICYGSQNVILSGNPEMTYFYKTFKKYTHFSFETTSKLMDGPTDYPYDQSVQLKARVDRVGDLLSDCYFSFQIPAIYSKYQALNPATGPTKQLEFKWVRALGAAAIQSVSITVGPNKVQEFTGEYLMAKALIDYPKDKFEKWQRLVGDVPEITDPANGLYGNKTDTTSLYPTVFEDTRNTTLAQTNTPSIPSYTIYCPLPFWFTEEGQALPLIGLQYYPVDITINLNPSNMLYTCTDLSGYQMAPGYKVLASKTNIQNNYPTFVTASQDTTAIRNFFVDIGYTTPPLNTWPCSPRLHTTYIFLPEKERNLFATTPLMYLLRQVTAIRFPEILNNQLLRLDIHNPITRLILVPRRSDSLPYRNAVMNFSNWWDYPNRPKIDVQLVNNSQLLESVAATGLLVPNAQPDIVQALRVLANGNEVQESKSTSFFTDLTPFRYLSGGANRQLPVYTFELHSPTAQPAGSLNSSRITKFDLDLQVYPLPPNNTEYIYSINVYVENLNFFMVESGMGDNKYAL